MKLDARHWAAALTLSVAIHLVVAGIMNANEEPVLIAGGGAASVMLIGDSTVDSVASSAGEADEASETQPDDAESEVLTPTASETATAATSETVEAQTTETPPLEPLPTEAVKPLTPPDTLASMTSPQEVAPLAPETPTVKPVAPPVPKAKPEPARKREAAKPKSKAKPARDKKAPAKGATGKATVDAQKGSSASSSSTSGNAEGNAAVSNYPGKIASRLRRALRYPKSALGSARSGQVQIAFTVTASGEAVSVRILASSGSTILDQAAIDAVRRASPFPPIPDSAGRSQWPFAIPIQFKR
jgi:periplasmic protein TonB